MDIVVPPKVGCGDRSARYKDSLLYRRSIMLNRLKFAKLIATRIRLVAGKSKN